MTAGAPVGVSLYKLGVPFALAYCLHFSINSWQQSTGTKLYAFTKCLPILILILLSAIVHLLCKRRLRVDKIAHAAGIACSGFGDLVLAFDFLVPGTFWFGIAHLFYMSTFFNWRNLRLVFVMPLALLDAALLRHIITVTTLPLLVKIVLTMYSVILSVAIWSAISRYTRTRHESDLYRAIGYCIFGVSDTLLAINAFATPLPYSQFTILSTYYLAQWLLFVSNVKMSSA